MAFRLEAEPVCGDMMDVFDFALQWPMCGVGCDETPKEDMTLGDEATSPAKQCLDGGNQNHHESDGHPSSTLTSQNGRVSNLAATANRCIPTPSRRKRSFSETCRSDSRSSYPKRRKKSNVARLPPELMAMVIAHISAPEPTCALNLLVPDWKIHRERTLAPGDNSTQVVTYTRGTDLEVVDFNRTATTINGMFSSEYIRQFHRNHTHVFTLGTGKETTTVKVSDNNWRDLLPLRGEKAKAVLPFDDEPIGVTKKAAFLGCSAPAYQDLRHIALHSPLNLMQVNAESLGRIAGITDSEAQAQGLDDALDLDRAAHLWLSWSKMPNLESVFLDLRIYSHDLNTSRRCLSKYQIIDRAREMGRHLQLKTLVIAGLQSYSFETRYDDVTAAEIEQLDDIGGEPNWFKIFRSAIRPGGKIVLVDRAVDE